MQESIVRPMRCVFAKSGMLVIDNIAAGLGIIIYSPAEKLAAGMHILRAFPRDGSAVQDPVYCVSTAIPFVLDTFKEQGIQGPYSIAIAGAGSMLPTDMGDVGSKLIKTAKESFQQAGLPIKLEETGGARVRRMILHIDDGKIKIDFCK